MTRFELLKHHGGYNPLPFLVVVLVALGVVVGGCAALFLFGGLPCK